MGTIQGTGGSVTMFTGFDAKLSAWSAQLEVTVVDTSGFTDNGWRTKAPCIVSMSGSATGTADDTSTPVDADVMAATSVLADSKGTLVLIAASAATSCQYSGTALITSVSLSRPVDGKCDITFNFKYTGTITQQWDES
jgi:hypothetical protein